VKNNHSPRHCFAGLRAISNAMPIDREQADEIILMAWIHYDAMATRLRASSDTWATCCHVANIGVLLTEQGLGQALEPVFHRAQTALAVIQYRASNGFGWEPNKEEAEAICAAVQAHDAQLRYATPTQMRRALDTLRERIQAGETVKVEAVAA